MSSYITASLLLSFITTLLLPPQVTLKTTVGDLDIELWAKEAPKVRLAI